MCEEKRHTYTHTNKIYISLPIIKSIVFIYIYIYIKNHAQEFNLYIIISLVSMNPGYEFAT